MKTKRPHYISYLLILWYLDHQENKQEASFKEIWEAQGRAKEFFDNRFQLRKIVEEILEKHNLTPSAWAEICQRASSWRGWATEKEDLINKEIKSTLYKFPHINHTYYSSGMVSGPLTNGVKKGEVIKTGPRPSKYKLCPEMDQAITNRMNINLKSL